MKLYARPVLSELVMAGMLDSAATQGFVVSKKLPGLRWKDTSATQWLRDQGICLPAWIATELPASMKERIEATVSEILSQPYWSDISAHVREEIGEVIAKGVTEGKSFKTIRRELQESSAEFSAVRAKRVAATEAGAALNAGRMDSLEQAKRETGGLLGAAEWLTTIDDRTRETHLEADGQIVPIGTPFKVGAEEALYPAAPNLSAAERVNCRCSLISALSEEVGG